jgi:small-conductance mechanosensitive channel
MQQYAFETPAILSWIPAWAMGLALVVGALGTALAAHELLVRGLKRGLQRRSEFTRSLVIRTRAPGRLALMVAAASWALKVAPIPDGLERLFLHILLIAFIVLVGWAVMTAADIGMALYLRHHRTDVADNLHARKMLTQTRILRRLLNVLVFVVTAALVLMTIPGVKQVGVSLLAAGGAAGIIVGLALQPVLSNLLAGVQIAFTQPIRIDDAVVVQNEFGHVEEIKSTYVVIRLRDDRRLIVPLKFFLDQPFQNWTRESAALIAEVMLLVDQRVPIDRLRATVEGIVRAWPGWDGKLLKVEVNDVRERTLEIRCRISARNASEAVALRSEVREKVVGWLQREYPASLPRNGVEFMPPEAEPTPLAPRSSPREQRVQ